MNLIEALEVMVRHVLSGDARREAQKQGILKNGCPRCGDRVSFHSKSFWCHRCGHGANWDGSAGSLT